jgi:hypothetical protein
VVATTLVVVLGSGNGPSFGDATRAALSTDGSPPPTSGSPARIDDIAFPTWDGAVAVRHEELEGRRAVTVAYEGGVGYTVVAGEPLDLPDGARRTGPYAIVEHDGATVVTWRRGEHTCVLASRQVSARDLVRMAESTSATVY